MIESGRAENLAPACEILAAQADIVDAFKIFKDWTECYQYIIARVRQAPPLSQGGEGR